MTVKVTHGRQGECLIFMAGLLFDQIARKFMMSKHNLKL